MATVKMRIVTLCLAWLAVMTSRVVGSVTEDKMSDYHFDSDPDSGAFSYGFMVSQQKSEQERRARSGGLQRRTTDPVSSFGTQHERQANGQHNWGFFITDDGLNTPAFDGFTDRSGRLHNSGTEQVRTEINFAAGKQPIVFKVRPRPGPPLPEARPTSRPLGFLRPRPTAAASSRPFGGHHSQPSSSAGSSQGWPGVHSNIGADRRRPGSQQQQQQRPQPDSHRKPGGPHVIIDNSMKRPIVVKVNPPKQPQIPHVASTGSIKPPNRRPGAVPGIIVRDNPPPGPPFPPVVTDRPVRRPPSGGLREVYRPKPSGVFFVQGRVGSNRNGIASAPEDTSSQSSDLKASPSGDVAMHTNVGDVAARNSDTATVEAQFGNGAPVRRPYIVIEDELGTRDDRNLFSQRQGRLLHEDAQNVIPSRTFVNSPTKDIPLEADIRLHPTDINTDDYQPSRVPIQASRQRGTVRFSDTSKIKISHASTHGNITKLDTFQASEGLPKSDSSQERKENNGFVVTSKSSINPSVVNLTAPGVFSASTEWARESSTEEYIPSSTFPYSDVPWKAQSDILPSSHGKNSRVHSANSQVRPRLSSFGVDVTQPNSGRGFPFQFPRRFPHPRSGQSSSVFPSGNLQSSRNIARRLPFGWSAPVSTEPPVTTYRPPVQFDKKRVHKNSQLRNKPDPRLHAQQPFEIKSGNFNNRGQVASKPLFVKRPAYNFDRTEGPKVTTYRPPNARPFIASHRRDHEDKSKTDQGASGIQDGKFDFQPEVSAPNIEFKNPAPPSLKHRPKQRYPYRGPIRFTTPQRTKPKYPSPQSKPRTPSTTHKKPPPKPSSTTAAPTKRSTQHFLESAVTHGPQPFIVTARPNVDTGRDPLVISSGSLQSSAPFPNRPRPNVGRRRLVQDGFQVVRFPVPPPSPEPRVQTERIVVTHNGGHGTTRVPQQFKVPDVLESRSERFRARLPGSMSGKPATFPSQSGQQLSLTPVSEQHLRVGGPQVFRISTISPIVVLDTTTTSAPRRVEVSTSRPPIISTSTPTTLQVFTTPSSTRTWSSTPSSTVRWNSHGPSFRTTPSSSRAWSSTPSSTVRWTSHGSSFSTTPSSSRAWSSTPSSTVRWTSHGPSFSTTPSPSRAWYSTPSSTVRWTSQDPSFSSTPASTTLLTRSGVSSPPTLAVRLPSTALPSTVPRTASATTPAGLPSSSVPSWLPPVSEEVRYYDPSKSRQTPQDERLARLYDLFGRKKDRQQEVVGDKSAQLLRYGEPESADMTSGTSLNTAASIISLFVTLCVQYILS